MSRNELIEAYQSGRISRRTFIRGMVGIGLSVSVATVMADQLRAAPAAQTSDDLAGAGVDDVYDDVYGTPTPPAEPVTELPGTGSGNSSDRSSNWMKPMAILGAGTALAAGALRRLKGGTAKPE
jgi:hypothetical protein